MRSYFTDGPRPDPPAELWLVAEVLLDAIAVATGELRFDVNPDERHAARAWIASRSDRPWGFAWCCAVVGMDPGRVRRAIGRGSPRRPTVVVAGGRE